MKLEVIAGKEISIGKKARRSREKRTRQTGTLQLPICFFSAGVDLAVKSLSG